MEKICWQITVAAFMQPLQYDLRSPAPKDNSITNAATARSNLDTAIYIAGTILQLQSAMEFHRQLIHQQHLQSHLHCGNDPRVANHNGIPSATHPPAPLAIPCTLHDPTVANHNGILSTAHARNTGETPFTMRNRSEHDAPMIRPHTVSQPSHRRGRSSRFGDGLCMEFVHLLSKQRVSCICYLSKMHFVRDFLQNSIGNSSTSTTCNAICIAGTILQLQITMEFHRQLIHQHHLQSHLHCTILQLQITMKFCRPHMHEKQVKPHLQCGTDPSMIRPHTRPSRTRRTAEVDHRGSGTDFVWKNIGFRASAIKTEGFVHLLSLKHAFRARHSFKTPSATPPPAPPAMPFALRERS